MRLRRGQKTGICGLFDQKMYIISFVTIVFGKLGVMQQPLKGPKEKKGIFLKSTLYFFEHNFVFSSDTGSLLRDRSKQEKGHDMVPKIYQKRYFLSGKPRKVTRYAS